MPDAIEWYFYLFMGFIVAIAALGSFFQIRKYKAEDAKHPYHHPNPYKNL